MDTECPQITASPPDILYIYARLDRSAVPLQTGLRLQYALCPPTRAGIRDSGSFSSLQMKLCVFLEPLYSVRLKPRVHARCKDLRATVTVSHSQSQSHLREPDRHSTGSGGGERERERDQRLHLLHQAAIDARAAKTIESSLYLLPDFTPYMP
ncbi:predicted protein [Histoplasma capsulatum G186AR]|uniref:Uncharacterized protein n=1 Tax=Ajellomyces capsulatus (strain G186AR / H82 / ATCC MYA-2454 / RMSCC 2432) TaxID=447093 RepID=C0NYV7_AJECG|nr:uncharacterized protein HCBG_08337 [Histoplasma capsulatum G186AR]EEH03397.1 predicted protein [Histoplasma capsulatum G186AR]